jgi:hypothetical protein
MKMRKSKPGLAGRRRQGTSVMEMVLVIPLLATIIFLVWFLGWSMTNQQHVRISDRYAAWRYVHGGGVTRESLNDQFFGNKAVNIDIGYQSVEPNPTPEELVEAAGNVSPLAQSLADRSVGQRFPRGHRREVWAEFPSSVGLWQQFAGQISSASGREGVEWRHGEAQLNVSVTDQFLPDLESALSGVPAPGTDMATMIRQLYLGGW